MPRLTHEERKFIMAFQRNIDFLEIKIKDRKAKGEAVSYDEVWRKALIWALMIIERWFEANGIKEDINSDEN